MAMRCMLLAASVGLGLASPKAKLPKPFARPDVGDIPVPKLVDFPTTRPTQASSGGPAFNALEHLDWVFSKVMEFDGLGEVRCLECLDLFAGDAAVHRAYRRADLFSQKYDYATDSMDDITHAHGFGRALLLVCCVKQHGLLVAGPPCGSWIFMNTANHNRNRKCAWGDTDDQNIRLQNLLVANLVCLLMISKLRQVWIVLEQPRSSLMIHYEVMRQWSRWAGADYVSSYMRTFGGLVPKPTTFWGTFPLLGKLRRSWSRNIEAKMIRLSLDMTRKCRYTQAIIAKLGGLKKRKNTPRMTASQVFTKKSGKWVTGNRLHETAAYPAGFANELRDLHLLALETQDPWPNSGPYGLSAFVAAAEIMGLSGGMGQLATQINMGRVRLDPEQMPHKVAKLQRAMQRANKKMLPGQLKLNFAKAANPQKAKG